MEFGQPGYGGGYNQPPSYSGGNYYQYPQNQIQQPQPSGMPHMYPMNTGFNSQPGQSGYQPGGYPPQSGGAGGQQMFARNYKTVPCKYFHR